MIEYIRDDNGPPPAGHYSQATLFEGLLFISGQLPVDVAAHDHTEPIAAPFDVQAERALSNLLDVLTSSGGSPANLVKVTAYIVGVANWTTFNEVYGRIMGPVRPARSIVPVPELHFGYLVEVDAIAVGLNNTYRCTLSLGGGGHRNRNSEKT